MRQKFMKRKQTLTGMILMVILTGVTFYILFKDHSPASIALMFQKADPNYILAGFVCMFLFINCEAASVRTVMKTFGRKIPWGRSLRYSLANFYFSAITPSATGGQPMELYYMTRDQMGFAQSSFSLLTVSAVYQLTLLLYGFTMVLIKFSFVQSQSSLIKLLIILGILVNGAMSFCILMIIFCKPLAERLFMTVIKFLCFIHIVKDRETAAVKVWHIIEEYSRGASHLKKYPRVICKVVVFTICQFTCLFLVPYFAALALGIRAGAPLGFLAVQAILSLAVTAVPLPGSVGASEGGFLALYRGIAPSSQVFSLMIMSRGISFYVFLIGSGLTTAWLHLRKKNEIHL